MTAGSDLADFQAARPMLIRAAYRMLGSVVDAEDVVQDAWLRWAGKDRADVDVPAAFLRRTVVNLCLDRLASVSARRDAYPGPWLPEPIFEPEPADDVTLPLLLALERLSPLERAAFLLHDVFGESFDAVARALDRSPLACRQLASRARENVRSSRRRFEVDRAKGMEIAEAFLHASRMGDAAALSALLASDVRLHSDGGGKRPAVARVLEGSDTVRRALLALSRLDASGSWRNARFGWINGLPGFLTHEVDGLPQSTALLVDGEHVLAVYVMRNPDKLRRLPTTLN